MPRTTYSGNVMAASLHSFSSAAERRRDAAARSHRAYLSQIVDDATAADDLVAAAKLLLTDGDRLGVASVQEVFTVMMMDQFQAVLEYLELHSIRPMKAARLWSLCFHHLSWDTHEVMLGRQDFADRLGIAPRDVSTIMSTLEECGAISRERMPVPGRRGAGRTRYFVNPRVGSRLDEIERKRAIAGAPILRLIDGTEHPSQRKARAPAFAVAVL